jgi:hypothetical protein
VVFGQLGFTGGAKLIFFPQIHKKSIILLETQQHKKYAQTTPLDDGFSFLFVFNSLKMTKLLEI